MRLLKNFGTHDSGASAMEYALVASLIAVVIIASLGLAGNTVSHMFNFIGSDVRNVIP